MGFIGECAIQMQSHLSNRTTKFKEEELLSDKFNEGGCAGCELMLKRHKGEGTFSRPFSPPPRHLNLFGPLRCVGTYEETCRERGVRVLQGEIL